MFKKLKSGIYKGAMSSPWVRKNSGAVIFSCPICGKDLPGKCGCGWIKDAAGFRYRWIKNR